MDLDCGNARKTDLLKTTCREMMFSVYLCHSSYTPYEKTIANKNTLSDICPGADQKEIDTNNKKTQKHP